MPQNDDLLNELVNQVQVSEKYHHISEEIIREIGIIEMKKRGSLKEAVKFTRGKLHQIGAAYQEKPIPYTLMLEELQNLPHSLQTEESQAFCKRWLTAHSSSKERLPFIERIFAETLAPIAPVRTILDMAGGLNPLALPWMPVAQDLIYNTVDIYQDMAEFLNHFLEHFSIQGSAGIVDLTRSVPQQQAQVAFILKTIPCLEQVDKSAGRNLLEQINAENILVSFPSHSLGGHSKGMIQNYETHFNELVAGKNWKITRSQYPSELVFLIQK